MNSPPLSCSKLFYNSLRSFCNLSRKKMNMFGPATKSDGMPIIIHYCLISHGTYSVLSETFSEYDHFFVSDKIDIGCVL